jgi:hypothetical protein
MRDFIEAHQSKIKGVLSCFDRMLFRGYLPIMDGWGMAQFLAQHKIQSNTLKAFLTETAQRVKDHAWQMAQDQGRPYRYLRNKIPMERCARQMAADEGIDQGLVCIFGILEPCRSFSFRFGKGQPYVKSARRKCMSLYYYFIDKEFGLIHIKLQTWFPMVIQVYVNGHEWLARKLSRHGIEFTKLDNVFIDIGDLERAQVFADRFCSVKWPGVLDCFARRINPLMKDLLKGLNYYWVTTQSEYGTDIMFKGRNALQQLYPRLLSHSTLCFGAKDIMSFLGRKLVGQFQGEIITDLFDLTHRRIPGTRVKHRVKENWLKMYDKAGVVLRVEMVINNPEEFRVRKCVTRRGVPSTEWVQMRKGVGYLFRYREVSLRANGRYLDALAVVTDPTVKVKELAQITQRKRPSTGRPAKALNPLSKEDLVLFKAVMQGGHNVRGFTNRDIRCQLAGTSHLTGLRSDPRRQSAKVSRLLHRLHLHRLIAKIPRSRKWRTTRFGRRLMATAIQVKELTFPQLLALAA